MHHRSILVLVFVGAPCLGKGNLLPQTEVSVCVSVVIRLHRPKFCKITWQRNLITLLYSTNSSMDLHFSACDKRKKKSNAIVSVRLWAVSAEHCAMCSTGLLQCRLRPNSLPRWPMQVSKDSPICHRSPVPSVSPFLAAAPSSTSEARQSALRSPDARVRSCRRGGRAAAQPRPMGGSAYACLHGDINNTLSRLICIPFFFSLCYCNYHEQPSCLSLDLHLGKFQCP
jgi:hypothetical protein